MGRTNSQASRRYDELIAKQAAKTKEQAATAKELALELDRHSKVAFVLGQHFTRDLHMKRYCNARAQTLNATHARITTLSYSVVCTVLFRLLDSLVNINSSRIDQ